MDAFDFALGVILSQPGKRFFFHVVGFRPCKFSPVEINYDKKLLAIVDAFEDWRHLLEGTQHKIIVYFDHNNI
jgi:hypothetical protein